MYLCASRARSFLGIKNSAGKALAVRIESFSSILEDECYSRYEFESFMEAYGVINEYMRCSNERRRYGIIKYIATNIFYEALMRNSVRTEKFSVQSLELGVKLY